MWQLIISFFEISFFGIVLFSAYAEIKARINVAIAEAEAGLPNDQELHDDPLTSLHVVAEAEIPSN